MIQDNNHFPEVSLSLQVFLESTIATPRGHGTGTGLIVGVLTTCLPASIPNPPPLLRESGSPTSPWAPQLGISM